MMSRVMSTAPFAAINGSWQGCWLGSPCVLYNRGTGTELLKFLGNGIFTEMGKVFRDGQRNARRTTTNIW